MRNRRWNGENDRHFWPLTLSTGDYKRFGFMLDSGANEDCNSGCHIRLYLWTVTLICELPPLIVNYRVRHIATSWDEATIKRLGRNWYDELFPREYGLHISEGTLHIHYGPQTHCSTDTKSKCVFLPWRNWRFIGKKWYGLHGEFLRAGGNNFQEDFAFENDMPKARFAFDDFDGRRIQADTHIEEREWRFGTGYFKWLSLFRRRKIVRSLSIRFSEGVGPEKGSWKGGTVGTSIDMLQGELHEAAFKRFCEKEHRSKYRTYRVQYIGATP